MKSLFEYIYNFFFNRWTSTVIEEGRETWVAAHNITGYETRRYDRDFIKYKLTNKFDKSEKIKKVYLD